MKPSEQPDGDPATPLHLAHLPQVFKVGSGTVADRRFLLEEQKGVFPLPIFIGFEMALALEPQPTPASWPRAKVASRGLWTKGSGHTN